MFLLSLLYGADVLIDKTSQPLVDGRYWMPELTSYNSAPFLQTKTTFFQILCTQSRLAL